MLQTIWEQIQPKREGLTSEQYKGDITDNLGTSPTKKGGLTFGYYNGTITDKLGTNQNKTGGIVIWILQG